MRILDRVRSGIHVGRLVAKRFESHSLFSHSAALGFYLFFSLPPAALAIVSLIGWIPIDRALDSTAAEMLQWLERLCSPFVPEEIRAQLPILLELHVRRLLDHVATLDAVDLQLAVDGFLNEHLSRPAAMAIGGVVRDIMGNPSPGMLTLSFGSVLWAASAATRALLRALGVIHEERRRGFLLRNLLAFGMTIAFLFGGVLGISLLFLGNGLADLALGSFGLAPWIHVLWSAGNWVLGLMLLLGGVMVLNRFGARSVTSFASAFPGSVLCVTLWVALVLGLRYWTAWSWGNYNATYGTLTGVIVVLFLCYLASLALLLGAEVNSLRATLRDEREALAKQEHGAADRLDSARER